MKSIALILAGGSGHRMGQDIPKQFLCVDSKPVIVYTLENFQKCEAIDYICVACSVGWEAFVTAYAKQFNITKLRTVVEGGENRFMSVYNLLKAINSFAEADDIIMTYDAVRPIITSEIIEDSIEKVKKYGAASGVIPCFDSLYATQEKGEALLSQGKDRDVIFRAMGPDATTYGKAIELFEKHIEIDTNINLIEMCFANGMKVAKSKSSAKCLKLTTVEDIELFHALLKYEKFDWLK